MLKVYGIDTTDFPHATAAEIITELRKRVWTEVDSETFGFDAHTKGLMCLQLGNPDVQYVIHPDRVGEFRDFLQTAFLIFHNAKFDLQFLYKQGIWPSRVYDTMLAEQVIHRGISFVKIKHNLAAVAKRRIQVDIDKSVRDNIWKEGLTRRVIQYAGDDVKYLTRIKEAQQADLERLDLLDALEIENQFVLALAYTEYSGFTLDAPRWQRKMAQDLEMFRLAEEELNTYILSQNIGRFIDRQMDLFGSGLSTTINWQSPRQVIELFEILGIPVDIVEKGVEKQSVAEKYIGKYVKDFPFIEKYLKFKEYQKLVSTYGQNFIDQINPVTERVHTRFRQIVDTGRLSSGGKNRETKEAYLNFQNIPSDKETRACFIAAPGNTLLVSDYSGQEQIVLANFSMDINLLEFYDNGLSDMHSFVASKMWEELVGLTLDEIKELHKDKRQKAKSAGFAINYGGNGRTIADNLNCSIEEGDAVFNGYFEAFPGLKQYFEDQKKSSLELGYILINEVTRSKTFIDGFEEFTALRRQLNRVFWDRWKRVKLLPEDNAERMLMRQKIKDFFKMKGDIERASLNYPIQGSSAEITKIAVIYFFRWIVANGLQGIVLIPNLVHDEVVAEAPIEMAEEVVPVLRDCMVRAGAIYCKRVPLLAEPEISPFWKK